LWRTDKKAFNSSCCALSAKMAAQTMTKCFIGTTITKAAPSKVGHRQGTWRVFRFSVVGTVTPVLSYDFL
jgi:hypothetical protein